MKMYERAWLIGICLTMGSVSAQAFCALRDPIRNINSLHAPPVSFRSSVASIDADIYREVRRRLPFSLHARELGRHTLYMLSREGAPDGYVHARSEASRTGMVEIVWSLDESLHIRGFRFQRCRSPQRAYFESAEFHDWIRGRGFSDLLEAIPDDGDRLSPDLRGRFEGREELAVSVLRSALKTILVTEIAWGDEMAERRLSAMLVDYCKAEKVVPVIVDGQPVAYVGLTDSGQECGRAVRLPRAGAETRSQALFVFDTRGECLGVWGADLYLPKSDVAGSLDDESNACEALHLLQERARKVAATPR